MHLQVFWIGALILGSLKFRFQVFKGIWMFLQIIVPFFLALNIDVVNIILYIILSMEFVFITKFIPNPQKLI
jgi:hypothetical protein